MADLDIKPAGGLSHVMGECASELIEKTIPAILADTVSRWPERLAAAFCDTGTRWNWAEFATEVEALAGGLHALGLTKGDRLGVWAPNRPEWLLAQFATARLGVILVTINPAYRVSEMEFALKKTGCKAVLLAERFKSSDYLQMLTQVVPELGSGDAGALAPARLPDLQSVIVMGDQGPQGGFTFDEILQKGRDVPAPDVRLDPNDPINIQFTSGTTGLPKGATLTHRNILNNARYVMEATAVTEQDRICIPVPFYHCFGMVMGTLGAMVKGAAVIIPSEGFDPEACLRAVSAEKATSLYGVPTMFVGILEHPDFKTYDLSSLRTGIMAGAPCPIEVMKHVQADMHMREVTIAYGMTETSPVSFQSSIDTPLDKRVGSVGRVHPHVEVKIVDEKGQTVPIGAQGEFLTRGYSVMKGYWDEPERTAESIDADGWMHTGDLARIDAEGYCNITGRVKDMICRGGENIYPREVEEFLYTHPAVSQVQVFGVPDERLGEIVCAWVVPKPGSDPTEEDIRAFCKDQIAHFKVPALMRFKDELPMTVTGKPKKFQMRAAMVDELGLSEASTA